MFSEVFYIDDKIVQKNIFIKELRKASSNQVTSEYEDATDVFLENYNGIVSNRLNSDQLEVVFKDRYEEKFYENLARAESDTGIIVDNRNFKSIIENTI